MKATIIAGIFWCISVAGLQAQDVASLVKQLASKDVEQRRTASKALGEAGPGAKAAVPALATALKDSDRFVRRFAAQALAAVGPDAKAALPALKAALQDENKDVVKSTIDALSKIGPDAITILGDAAKAGKLEPELRLQIIDTLIDGKADPKVIAPLFGELLKKEQSQPVRMDLVKSLGKMGKNAKPAVGALADAVTKGDRDLRMEAIRVLGGLGADAKEAAPALKALADSDKDQDKNFKKPAADALAKIEGKKK